MPHSLSLRPLRVDDAEAMAAVLADPDLYTYTGGTPPGEKELRQRYAILARGRSEDGEPVDPEAYLAERGVELGGSYPERRRGLSR